MERKKSICTQVLDPGGELVGPNFHVSVLVVYTMISATDNKDDRKSDDENSRTGLKSNKNMEFIGRHSNIISNTVKTEEVSPFTPEYEVLYRLPIVN